MSFLKLNFLSKMRRLLRVFEGRLRKVRWKYLFRLIDESTFSWMKNLKT